MTTTETTTERLARLRQIAPPGLATEALRYRIKQGWSDARCVMPPMGASQARQIAGRRRAQQMRSRGERPVTLPGSRV